MSAYTAQIETYVTTNFPVATYPVSQQAELIALGEAQAALVNPAQPTKQYAVAMLNTLRNNPYFANMDPLSAIFNQVLVFCEYCLDLAMVANQPIGVGAKLFMNYISQAGVVAPTFDFPPVANSSTNTFSENPTLAYSGPGSYLLTFPSLHPFPSPGKVEVQMGIGDNTKSSEIKAVVSADNELSILTNRAVTSNLITGEITAAGADDLLSATLLKFVVYP